MLIMASLFIECTGCRLPLTVYIPRSVTMTPEEIAREQTSEDSAARAEGAAARHLRTLIACIQQLKATSVRTPFEHTGCRRAPAAGRARR